MARNREEFTVITPTGETGIWTFISGAEDYLLNGSWEQATDYADNYIYDEDGEPVMIQTSPIPPSGSYVAVRRYVVTDWEPVVLELQTTSDS